MFVFHLILLPTCYLLHFMVKKTEMLHGVLESGVSPTPWLRAVRPVKERTPRMGPHCSSSKESKEPETAFSLVALYSEKGGLSSKAHT